ncbi:MAG: hypothetical protein ACFFAX_02130 [Promethearchaeota archaeon]
MSYDKKRICFPILVVLAAFILSTQFLAGGFPSISNDCSTSGCHTNDTGMAIQVSSSSFEVNPGTTIELNISASGELCKFPSELVDNSAFVYEALDDEGSVRDGDVADLNTEVGKIDVEYKVIVPSTLGSYTLWFFIAANAGRSNSTQISVIVVTSTPTPVSSNTTATSPTSTTPAPIAPWIDISALLILLNPNLLFTWGFLSALLLAIMYLTSRDKPKPRAIIPGSIILAFGWAAIIQSGYRFNPAAILILIAGFIIVWYAELQARRIVERRVTN